MCDVQRRPSDIHSHYMSTCYLQGMRRYVVCLNIVMLLAGGIATIPWLSWHHQVFWCVCS